MNARHIRPSSQTGSANRLGHIMMTTVIVMFLSVGSAVTADALDLKDLLPCRTAAARLCDRSQGTTVAALYRCGAVLASRHEEVGRRCQNVLIRYGQLSR
jgi:hypothetical protein